MLRIRDISRQIRIPDPFIRKLDYGSGTLSFRQYRSFRETNKK